MGDFIYRIIRRGSGVCLTRESRTVNQPIGPYLFVVNHSPDGFEYGYGGSGPAQLALAILCYHTRDNQLAMRLHQDFKKEFIQSLDIEKDEHAIQPAAIDVWLKSQMERENYADH